MRTLARVALTTTILGAVACEPGAQAPAPPPAQPESAPVAAPALPERRVLVVRGEVKVDGQAGAQDMPLGEGATVETGEEGYAVLTLGKGSLVEVRAHSKLTLGSSARAKTAVKLVAGMVWSFLPDGASYEVETANAVAGVRGTVFFVQADATKSYVCACTGAVRVETSDGKTRREVNADAAHAHQAFSIAKRGQLKKAGLKHHTDAQAQALAPILDSIR